MTKKKAQVVDVLDPQHPAGLIDLAHIVLWEDNYNEGDVGKIARSILRFGFVGAPSLWKDFECRAKNHSVMALRWIQTPEGKSYATAHGHEYPPRGVRVVQNVDGSETWRIPYIDISYLSATEATAYAIADNNLAKQATTDDHLLAKYLLAVKQDDEGAFEATGFDDEELSDLLSWLNPPELGDLANKYGKHEDDAFWPVIRVRVPQETFDRFQAVMAQFEGDEAQRFAALLDLADGNGLA